MEAKQVFDEFILEDSFIGVHGVSGKRNYNHDQTIEEVTKSILDNGLNVTDWGGLLSNVVLLGNKEDFTFFEVQSYSYPSNLSLDDYNIVVSIPSTITSRTGETYFLGCLPRTKDELDSSNRGLDDEIAREVKFNPINRYVIDNKLLPPELIAGCVVTSKDNVYFIKNEKYIGTSKEIEENFVDKFNPSKYNLINIDEDINVIEDKYRKSIETEETFNIHGYSYYNKHALEFMKEKNRTL